MKFVLKIVDVGIALLLVATFAQGQTRASLQEQKMCYEQAKKVFDAEAPTPGFGESRSFTSHYSRKMNACYMEVHTLLCNQDGCYFDGNLVTDAFEGREIGECDREKDNAIKECYVYPTPMHSFKEFVSTIRRATGLYGGGD